MPTEYCRHIRPSGRRCQSPALRSRAYCFHHANAKAHLRALQPPQDGTYNVTHELTDGELNAIRREPLLAEYYINTRGPVLLDFPPLEDANAIQLALSMILTVLGQNRIEPARASSMLYNLQIATVNSRNVTHNESNAVRDIVHDEEGDLLSPDEDPKEVLEEQQFLIDFAQHEQDLKDGKHDDDDEDEDDF